MLAQIHAMSPHAGALLPLPAPPQTSLPPAIVQKATQAAKDFEAVALNQFLAPMFATVDLSATPFGGGEAEQTWQPMLVNEMARKLSASGGIGIAHSVLTEMLRLQEAQTLRTRQEPKR